MADRDDSLRAAVRSFILALPELELEWQQHIAREGEPLVTVFVEQTVCPLAVKLAKGGDRGLLQRLMAALEELADSDEPWAQSVVSVSFIEFLAWGDEDEQAALRTLTPSFGPAMRKQLQEFQRWSEGAPPPGR